MDISTLKAELIRDINETNDPGFLEKLKMLYAEFKSRSKLTPMTWEELYDRLDKAEADFQAGRIISQEDLEQEAKDW